MNLFAYDFVVRALLGALFTGLAAPAVGTYLVQRRLALMGDGIGHIAVTGVALGLLTGASPTITAVIVAVIGAVVIELIRESGRTSGDVALALLFYGGIAGGVLITGIAGQSAATLNTYLFGSITTISSSDVWVTVVLAAVVVVVAVGLSPQLFAVAQDQEFARVAGLPVRFYNLLISVMAAVTVTVAMRTVGLLLVSALMVVPVATSQQLTRAFRATLFAAMGLGMLTSLGGVVISAYVDAAPGATIVLLALACFATAYPLGVWLRRRQRLRQPFTEPTDELALDGLAGEHTTVPEDHTHEHGADCGHKAVPHGDHVDYVHDGHRHAVHGSQYDQHLAEPPPGRAPDPAAPGGRHRAAERRRLPQRPGHPRPAAPERGDRRAVDGLPHLAGARRRWRARRAAHRRRRGGLPALLGDPPPPPRLPGLRAHRRGGGPDRGEVGRRGRRPARFHRCEPHPRDLRDLSGLLTGHRLARQAFGCAPP